MTDTMTAALPEPAPSAGPTAETTAVDGSPTAARYGIGLWLAICGVALQPIQWITVAGPLVVADAGLLLIAIGLAPRVLRGIGGVSTVSDGYATLLTGTMALCAVCLGLSVAWSPVPMVGLGLLFRDLAVVIVCFYIYAAFRDDDTVFVATFFATGLRLAAVLMVVAITLTLAAQGVNVFKSYQRAITTANPNLIQYEVFNRLYGDPEEVEGAFGRHTMFLLVAVGAVMVWLLIPYTAPSARPLLWAQFVAMQLLVALSLSRQACLVSAVTIALITLRSPSLKVRFGAVVLGAIVALGLSSGPAQELIQAKFVDDVVENPRLRQWNESLSAIGQHPGKGRGAGVKIRGSMKTDYYAHNLVLHGWHQAGLIGLAGASIAAAALLYVSIKAGRLAFLQPDIAHSLAGTAALALFSVPILRYLLGVRGSLEIASLLAMAIGVLLLHGAARDTPSTDTAWQ